MRNNLETSLLIAIISFFILFLIVLNRVLSEEETPLKNPAYRSALEWEDNLGNINLDYVAQ